MISEEPSEMDSREIAQRCADSMFARDKASRELGITVEISARGWR
jgi:hypothetical protein